MQPLQWSRYSIQWKKRNNQPRAELRQQVRLYVDEKSTTSIAMNVELRHQNIL